MILKKRVAFLLLLILCVPLSAQVKEKLITVDFSDLPLSEAINRIEKVSRYTFFYDANQVDVKQKVSLKVKKATAQQAMNVMLKNTDLKYEVTNTQIALFTKDKPEALEYGITIKGQVVDEHGEPIIGGNVIAEGTTNGTITNIDGYYTLTVAPDARIQISYIGYTTQTLKAGSIPAIVIDFGISLQNLPKPFNIILCSHQSNF